ncbi:MAG: putative LPS assembly protein LptD, partial [Rhodothermales bacterium]
MIRTDDGRGHKDQRYTMKYHKTSSWLLLLLFCVSEAQAQDRPPPLPAPQPDSVAVGPDTSLVRADTTAPRLPAPGRADTASGLDKPIEFTAKDSLIIRFDDEDGDRGRLVGNAVVTYGEVKLEAHTIDILFDLEELRAEGVPSDTGLVGTPLFSQGGEVFYGTSFAYNMGTERGRIVGARTQFEDGFIRAGVAKVREDSTVFISDGLYTTCNCGPDETPSYSMRSDKMKIVDQKWVYTGPIQLYIYNIPTPFWLPFGFLPYQEGRRSGLLAPEYGEDQRGFYLRNWGYYWAINDFMDLQMRAGVWTQGSWQINPSYRYNRRDYFSGGLSFDFVHERSGEKEDPDAVTRNNVSLRWSHNQTLNPTARLTANVNLTSSSYLRTVSDQYADNVRQSISSSIQYNKRWQGGRSFSINLRQNQVLATGSVDLTLPEVSFSQSSVTPFKRSGGGGRNQQWYERIQFNYSGRLSNRFNFLPLSDDDLLASGDPEAADIGWFRALLDQEEYERATGREDNRFDFKTSHRVPISAPFSINRLPLIGTFRLN